jgi:hypothetical protein
MNSTPAKRATFPAWLRTSVLLSAVFAFGMLLQRQLTQPASSSQTTAAPAPSPAAAPRSVDNTPAPTQAAPKAGTHISQPAPVSFALMKDFCAALNESPPKVSEAKQCVSRMAQLLDNDQIRGEFFRAFQTLDPQGISLLLEVFESSDMTSQTRHLLVRDLEFVFSNKVDSALGGWLEKSGDLAALQSTLNLINFPMASPNTQQALIRLATNAARADGNPIPAQLRLDAAEALFLCRDKQAVKTLRSLAVSEKDAVLKNRFEILLRAFEPPVEGLLVLPPKTLGETINSEHPLHSGDIVMGCNGKIFSNLPQLKKRVAELDKTSPVNLQVWRNGVVVSASTTAQLLSAQLESTRIEYTHPDMIKNIPGLSAAAARGDY